LHITRRPEGTNPVFLIVILAHAFPAGREIGDLHLTSARKTFGGAQRNAAQLDPFKPRNDAGDAGGYCGLALPTLGFGLRDGLGFGL
jgi:hypothetical protein